MSQNGDGQKRGASPASNPPPGVSCDICKKPDDSRMVACDSCEQWYHFACVSVDSNVQDRDWSCEKCLEAATKVPAGTSTPLATGGAVPKSSVNKQTEPSRDDQLQKQLVAMQKRLKEFERVMKEKDDQRVKELRDQQKRYDQELKDTERRVRELLVSQQQLAEASGGNSTAIKQTPQMASGGGPTACSTGNPVPQIVVNQPAYQSNSGIFRFPTLSQIQQQLAAGLSGDASKASSIGNQSGGWPAASSTGNPLPQVQVNQEEDDLAKELQLLQEKQALENKHWEERNQLLQRYGKVGGGATGGYSGLNPQATAFQPNNNTLFGVPSLSQSQVSARQAVNKELPSFSGNPEEWPLFLASYENSTRICGYSDEENLLRLQRSLKGRALEAVRCRLLHPTNLPSVIATLKTLFGRPEIIIHSLVNKIREMPAPKS